MTRSLISGPGWLAVMVLALSISGCGGSSIKDSLGFGKRQPDEFAVVKRQPLIIPPDYDLRPPRPGAPSTAVASAEDRARAAMTGSEAGGAATAAPGVAGPGLLSASAPEPAPSAALPSGATAAPAASPGQAALLAETGAAAGGSSGIRQQIAAESEGRTEVAPAAFARIVEAPGGAGAETPDVVRREQAPIDLAE